MDYIFRDNVITLLKGIIDTKTFVKQLKYKENLRFNKCWNMLGSHDTSRIRGVLRNDKKSKLHLHFNLLFQEFQLSIMAMKLECLEEETPPTVEERLIGIKRVGICLFIIM